MNTIAKTLTAATLALALVGTTVALTTTSAEAGSRFSSGIKGGKGVIVASGGGTGI